MLMIHDGWKMMDQTCKKLKKEIEFHFNIRKFRLYYYDDDQQVFKRVESLVSSSWPAGNLLIISLPCILPSYDLGIRNGTYEIVLKIMTHLLWVKIEQELSIHNQWFICYHLTARVLTEASSRGFQPSIIPNLDRFLAKLLL